MTDYGTDVLALDDLPDPETLATGATNVAYACARRLLTPSGGQADTGLDQPYASLDSRAYLGRRLSDRDLRDLEMAAHSALTEDARVDTATVAVTFAAGVLTIAFSGEGSEGPFSAVLSVADATATLILQGG